MVRFVVFLEISATKRVQKAFLPFFQQNPKGTSRGRLPGEGRILLYFVL